MAEPLAGRANSVSFRPRVSVSAQQQSAPSTRALEGPQPSSANRLASGLDQVTITPMRIETPKATTSALNASISGSSLAPSKSFSPRATANYAQLGVEQKRQMVQLYPKAVPEQADLVAPRVEEGRGPQPSPTANSQAMHAMRPAKAPDVRAVPGNPEATVSKLRPIRDQLSLRVGQLSPVQASALIGAGMNTAAAQAAVVHENMAETRDQMAASRKRLKAMQDSQREHSVRIARRLKVKFDSVPQHLRDFAARTAKEVVVPMGLEKTPLEKMLSAEGVVGFKGPGMAAYDNYMANQ